MAINSELVLVRYKKLVFTGKIGWGSNIPGGGNNNIVRFSTIH